MIVSLLEEQGGDMKQLFVGFASSFLPLNLWDKKKIGFGNEQIHMDQESD